MAHNAHDLEFTVLNRVSHHRVRRRRPSRTLNLLSCNTRLMAASSPDGESFVWNTTPKDPLPTILHCVYCISRVSPVTPSCTFSRMTSVPIVLADVGESPGGVFRPSYLPSSDSKRLQADFATSCGPKQIGYLEGGGLVVRRLERRADDVLVKSVLGNCVQG